jgi:hypothetical protein
MLARLVARRDLVAFVRQPAGLWDLCLLGLLIAGLVQTARMSPFAISLVGLAVAWQWTSRRAGTILLDGDRVDRSAINNLRRAAGLAHSVGWMIAAIVTYGWWACSSADKLQDPTSLVIVASLLGGALLIAVLQNSWRIVFAGVALSVMSVVLIWQVTQSWSHPDPWPASGLSTFARLLILFCTGATLDAWAHPIGTEKHWLRRCLRILLVAPLLAGLMVTVELAPASLIEESLARRSFWLAAWVTGLVMLVILYSSRCVRRTPLLTAVRAIAYRTDYDPGQHLATVEILAACPPLLLITSASTATWLAAFASFVIARLAAGLARRGLTSNDLGRPTSEPASKKEPPMMSVSNPIQG